MIHSCSDVDELLDDLVDIGLDCFNPLQPEVMDATALMKAYRWRLSFYVLATAMLFEWISIDATAARPPRYPGTREPCHPIPRYAIAAVWNRHAVKSGRK